MSRASRALALLGVPGLVVCAAVACAQAAEPGSASAAGSRRAEGSDPDAKPGGSADSAALLETAEALARSGDSDDHQRLYTHLSSRSYLERLDSPADYEGPARGLGVARVLRALADNPATSAREVLVQLVGTPAFVGQWQRDDLLIEALTVVASPPPAVIGYWRVNSAPGAVHRHTAMRALCDNASPGAVGVLHENLTNPLHPEPERRAWLRDPVLRNRDQAEILEASERMLRGTLAPEMRVYLVEALFDYRPMEWYRVDAPPRPPDPSEFSAEARAAYRRVGALALESVPLSEDLRRSVRAQMPPNPLP